MNGGTGDLSEVAARVQASVVSIEVRSGNGRGTGSGFVIDRQGHVLTNAHVVEDGGQVTVTLADRRRIPAQVTGSDPALDLAVLSIPAGQSPAPLTFGRFSDVRVGDPVLALGSPLGLQGTVTGGIVSALNREVRIGAGRGEHGAADRRVDQPRQLRRAAGQRARRGRRREHGDRDADARRGRRLHRHRVRDPRGQGAAGGPAARPLRPPARVRS
ncbi:S1C family serine protease [Actinomadura madurae]|uniref:S1C family serine protease n=1 Tax=Actinomadura madurae TaxID=1993 RepID=UPI0020D21883|nr:trypsin-like peptidase domain-containing protein [Actinomadura madurae]MCP9965624.1 S1C family serine protease [Actinomadura madurae]